MSAWNSENVAKGIRETVGWNPSKLESASETQLNAEFTDAQRVLTSTRRAQAGSIEHSGIVVVS